LKKKNTLNIQINPTVTTIGLVAINNLKEINQKKLKTKKKVEVVTIVHIEKLVIAKRAAIKENKTMVLIINKTMSKTKILGFTSSTIRNDPSMTVWSLLQRLKFQLFQLKTKW